MCIRKSGGQGRGGLFLEYKVNGGYEEQECQGMVPPEGFSFEGNGAEYDEHRQRDDFLDDLQLNQAERASVVAEADAVGGHLETIFEESQEPTEKDDPQQREVFEPTELLLQLQVPVPGACHEDVGNDQHRDSKECLHIIICFLK